MRNISRVEQEFQRASGTQTIDRAAQLLTLVLEAERPRPLADLAGDAALPKSTASRLLGALERQGLVRQQGRRGSFGPGPVLVRFAHRGLVDRHLAELAQPHLNALSAASDETINLAIATPLGVEHLAQVESRHYLGTGQWIGRRVPYHCTAVGKVLIAFGAAGLPSGPLEPLTPATIVDRARLAAEVRAARSDGCATAIDELELGLTSLAAPVLGAGGEGLAALAISGPTLRLDAARMGELRPQLIHEARALGARLGDHDTGAHAA
jgi:IclR family transcriptional regulator, acetate operon repressor